MGTTSYIEKLIDVGNDIPENELIFGGIKPALFRDPRKQLDESLTDEVLYFRLCGQIIKNIIS